MKFTIQDASTLDPAALANELIVALGSNFGISTAGVEITTNGTDPDQAAFQSVLDAHVAASATRKHNANIQLQIDALEGRTERGIREAVLYSLVVLAAAQGITEPQLYAANFGYKKAKDLNTEISNLRAQRI